MGSSRRDSISDKIAQFSPFHGRTERVTSNKALQPSYGRGTLGLASLRMIDRPGGVRV
jgi:hypothetical protein